MLVGNKCDLRHLRAVQTEVAKAYVGKVMAALFQNLPPISWMVASLFLKHSPQLLILTVSKYYKTVWK